ncbi:hypothetical protein Bca52824_029790 [Brassica carinata]|uniref:Helicase ATP-binding domain-containing protein n=1 Tax=Brassica carinata TaxID=52824 RepID=A0A8X7V3Q8_BRACI|nr:hypothetical protein Bca52824_029790 [Brassica carinata]
MTGGTYDCTAFDPLFILRLELSKDGTGKLLGKEHAHHVMEEYKRLQSFRYECFDVKRDGVNTDEFVEWLAEIQNAFTSFIRGEEDEEEDSHGDHHNTRARLQEEREEAETLLRLLRWRRNLGSVEGEAQGEGYRSSFPIQATTFDMVLDGADLVGRARTGQGKTLAFVLPILESLINGPSKNKRKNGYGRPPSVLVLLPTRELAKQVFADFDAYGGSVGLTSCCVYGGDPYPPQQAKLKRGVDIVVGTPGRIKDHIERQNLDLTYLQFRVLDEADEMLRMGFVDDVELILGKVEDPKSPDASLQCYLAIMGPT